MPIMFDYSDPTRESLPTSLPDIEIYQMTAEEVLLAGSYEEEIHEAQRLHQFRLATVDSTVRQRLIDYLVGELGLEGGWYWQACFPGCLPDGEPTGPFPSYAEAKADAQRQDW